MKDTKYLEIIKAPVITEKSQIAKSEGKYTFKVAPNATKLEIKDAIEKIFKVKVTSVRTMNVKPKKRRVGRYTGLTNRSKKQLLLLQKDKQLILVKEEKNYGNQKL